MHSYFSGYTGVKTAFHCFKTVILGEVAAGKTSLRKTIQRMTSHLTDVIDRTVGVEQDVIQLGDNLQTCLHDFGGHETYTYLHQVCLTNQTLIGFSGRFAKIRKQELFQNGGSVVSKNSIPRSTTLHVDHRHKIGRMCCRSNRFEKIPYNE